MFPDPLTGAATLATLVGLITSFVHERRGEQTLNHHQFLEWLAYHRHDELKTMIGTMAGLQQEIESILRAGPESVLSKLNEIHAISASLFNEVRAFKNLAHAVAPEIELSEQAVSILEQFVASEAKHLFFFDYGEGYKFHFIQGKPDVEVPILTEERFIAEDLKSLERARLLSIEYNEDRMLCAYTRNALKFLRARNA